MLTLVIIVLAIVISPIVLFLAMNWLAPMAVAQFLIGLARKKAGLVGREARIQGFSMPYLEGGQGEPLVLVHGFGGSRDNFLLLAGLLVPKFRVLVPDLPGFGDATKDEKATYTIAEQAERLHQWLKAVGLERAHFAGNSMGGFIVAELAVRHPEAVSSLLLLNAAGIFTGTDNELSRRFRETGEMPLLVHSPADYDRLMSIAMSKPPKMPAAIRAFAAARAMENAPLHTRIAAMFADTSIYFDQRNQRIETPTLIVWGEEDKIIGLPAAKDWQKVCVNSRLAMLPGIGHLPMIEAPKRTADEYLSFLAGLPAQTPR